MSDKGNVLNFWKEKARIRINETEPSSEANLQDVMSDAMTQMTELGEHMEKNQGMLLQDKLIACPRAQRFVDELKEACQPRPQASINTRSFEEAQLVEMEEICQLAEVHVEQLGMLLETLALKAADLRREIGRRKGEGNDNEFSPKGEGEV